MKRLALLFCLLLILPLVAARVDIINPTQNYLSNNSTVTFDYRPSMPQLQSCTIKASQFTFPDLTPDNNTINTVIIQNIEEGQHKWNVSCTNGTTTETSPSQLFTIDTTPPTIQVNNPQEGSSQTTLAVDFSVSDNIDTTLTCTIQWNGTTLDTREVQTGVRFTQSYFGTPGTGQLSIRCTDDANNTQQTTRNVTLEPELTLTLTLDKATYGITEPVHLTIDTLPGSTVSVDTCPNQQGFVQCTSALLDTTQFPQTITLPYMNRTGGYLVEALSQYGNTTKVARVTYSIENSIVLNVNTEGDLIPNRSIKLKSNVAGGVAPYAYKWQLSNGTTILNAPEVNMKYATNGTYSETLTITDSASNTQSITKVINVKNANVVKFFVQDNVTQQPIYKADIKLDDAQTQTLLDGSAEFVTEDGTHTIFVSKDGYRYYLYNMFINASDSYIIALGKDGVSPEVTITSPEEGAQLAPSVIIGFTTNVAGTCGLYTQDQDGWMVELQNKTYSAAGSYSFAQQYENGTHTISVECTTSDGQRATSQVVTFTTQAPEQSTQDAAVFKVAEGLNQELDTLESIITNLDKYGPNEQAIMSTIEFDKNLRNAKRDIQQAIRDLDSLRYRNDLDQAGKDKEQANILAKVQKILDNTPVSFSVDDKRTFVNYVEESDLDNVFKILDGTDIYPTDSGGVRQTILEDQQKFTISSSVYHITYGYRNGKSATNTLVTRTFTYAKDLPTDYTVNELIPKDVYDDASKILFFSEPTILKKDPVVRFSTQKNIAYMIPKKIDFVKLETIQTLLAPEKFVVNSRITGFVVLPAVMGGYGTWLIILAIVIAVIYLTIYFDLLEKIKYVTYKFGKNEQVHYLRVLMHDAEDNLSAQDYGKAELLYKEIRLTYDTLSTPAKNDLYEEIMDLVHKMDAYYFNLVMIELDEKLKAGDMEGAINAYEKLTGTYERLDSERQKQLVNAVVGIAKRLGLGVPV